MTRVFYRVVEGIIVTRDDFMSYEALGKPLWNPTPQRVRQWRGISVFASAALARNKARDYNLGEYIAELSILDAFLRFVVSVVPVQEQTPL